MLVVCCLLWGCGGDRIPEDVMDEEQMTSFLEEAYMLEGFYAVESNFQYDTMQPEMIASYDSLLSSFDLTREEFEKSLTWYCHHSDHNRRVHQEVLRRLEER